MGNNEEKLWFNQEITHREGWECPSCGKVLPSGIVGIVDHWSKCGGEDFHNELKERYKNDDFGIDEIKEMQERHYGKH